MDDESRQWIESFVGGDPQAGASFWRDYGPGLQRLAEKQMAPALRQRIGADDIVQSACRTFVRRARQGEFELEDAEDLWRLLCAITLTKVRQHARFHQRQRRSVRREQSPGAEAGPLDWSADQAASPAEVAEFTDTWQKLLGSLDEEHRQLVQHKLDGCTHQEAADKLGCSERTVRRLLKTVQRQLRTILDDAASRA